MTKRDVAVWFCRVVAIVGMMNAALGLVSGVLSFGLIGGRGLISALPNFGLYLFIWFFATGIGTELAAEGEHGPPIISGAELGQMLLRCAGLWLFLSGAVTFGFYGLVYGYEYLSSGQSSLFGSNVTAYRFAMINFVEYSLKSVIGFALAFTPRLRQLFRS